MVKGLDVFHIDRRYCCDSGNGASRASSCDRCAVLAATVPAAYLPLTLRFQ
jgi:hypothetical protein